MINWKNFIPIGIHLIRSMYRRNLSGNNKPVEPDALKIVYKQEIVKLEEFLTHDLKAKDTSHSLEFGAKKSEIMNGMIRLADFKKIIRKTIFLTPKEKNLLIREIRENEVDYTKL